MWVNSDSYDGDIDSYDGKMLINVIAVRTCSNVTTV